MAVGLLSTVSDALFFIMTLVAAAVLRSCGMVRVIEVSQELDFTAALNKQRIFLMMPCPAVMPEPSWQTASGFTTCLYLKKLIQIPFQCSRSFHPVRRSFCYTQRE